MNGLLLKKKVLVTGVAGFLGSNLLDRLLQAHQVVGIDNLSMGSLENIKNQLNHPSFQFIQNDVVDLSTFESLPEDFDIIIHLAAFKIPRYGNAV